MSETAVWTDRFFGSLVGDNPPTRRRAVLMSVLILLLGIGVSAWMYLGETHALSSLARAAGARAGQPGGGADSVLLQQVDRWALWSAIRTVGVGTGILFGMVAGFVMWRRAWARRVQTWEEEWRKLTARLESQLADSRKSEEQLQELRADAQKRVTALESWNSQLQSELDKLKRAGKTLTLQHQVLESSKTVLELHVRARTEDLESLQRRYEHILNYAGEGICGLDREGKTTFANPAVAKLTGWPLEELIGKTEQEIFGQSGCGSQDGLAGHNPDERVIIRKDGECFPVECVRTEIKENEQVVGAVLIFKDITERKRAEGALAQNAAELARSNAELEQFAFVASHDLQEPLRKIQAFGDRLKTKCTGAIAAEAQDYLERMQSAAARMRRLIDDLLAFSRVIRSGEPFVRVDLTAVVKEVLGDLEVRIEKTGARVEVGDLPAIEADPMQMRQLLLNLIGNSLKFQPAGATPVVKVQARMVGGEAAADAAFAKPASTGGAACGPGPYCEISVVDNGIGFEEKYVDRIFIVFHRLHGRTEYEGTGVGLAVCRRIADRHHGTIIAKSKLGEGATFIVTLPATQPKAPPSQ